MIYSHPARVPQHVIIIFVGHFICMLYCTAAYWAKRLVDDFSLDNSLDLWIPDLLSHRSQEVVMGGAAPLSANTQYQQGCVLSLMLSLFKQVSNHYLFKKRSIF